ncbi:MAG: HpcH/HpaI aldolase/citrate lyase family protein [Reyranellaceae bacterium]
MSKIDLPFFKRLKADEIVVGMNIRHSRTSEIGPMLASAGYHWFFTDDEHSPVPLDRSYDINLAAIRAGVLPFVRARQNNPAEIGCHLSNGALGVFVPHVNTAAEAEAAAMACRYPPVGKLSVPGSIPQFGYTGKSLPELCGVFNDNVVCTVMIESPEAVANVDAIAAVKGVDVLFMGASDLTFEMGIPSQYGHDRVTDAVARVCAAARKHGKVAGMGGVKEPSDWARYTGMGMRVLLSENDLSMLMYRLNDRAKFFSGLPRS